MSRFNSFLVIVCLVFLGFLAVQNRDTVKEFFVGETKQIVQIGGVKLFVSVADTPAERTQGLSGTAGLGDFEAMLFVFDTVDRHGIWMKEMNYPIDIFWIDDEMVIVHIEHNVSPNTYPQTFKPDRPARYVLETKAHTAKTFNFKTGQQTLIPDEITARALSK